MQKFDQEQCSRLNKESENKSQSNTLDGQSQFQTEDTQSRDQSNQHQINNIHDSQQRQNQIINQDHECNHNILDKQEIKNDENLQEYIISENDTLIGIAIRINVVPQFIKKLNSFSNDEVYKGQKILLSQKQVDKLTNQKVEQEVKQSDIHLDSKSEKDIPTEQPNIQKVFKYNLIYLDNDLEVSGILNLNEHLLMFNPQISSNQDLKRVIKYQVYLNSKDVFYCKFSQSDYHQNGTKYIKANLKIFHQGHSVGRINKTNIHNKVGDQYQNLEFKQIFLEEDPQSIHNLYVKLNNMINSQNRQQYEDHEVQQMLSEKKIFELDLQQSSILKTPKLKVEIVKVIPAYLQIQKWQVCFSSLKHGCSYNQMLRMSTNIGPNLMLIQDYNDNIFGAFLSDSLKINKQFYGGGETCLFKFENQNVNIYKWSYKNDHFIYTDKKYFGIGSGIDYGIYVDDQMQFGKTDFTYTFESPPLVKKKKFQIKCFEILAIQDNLKKCYK